MIALPVHPDRAKNARKAGEFTPCLICGKPIRQEARSWMVHVHCGGTHAVTAEEAATLNEAADLGLHPIGPDCLRKHPELKPYAQKWEEH